MKRYEVSVQVNSFAFVYVDAASEEEAISKAREVPYYRWNLDTDWSTAEEFSSLEIEGEGAMCGDCLGSLATCNCRVVK